MRDRLSRRVLRVKRSCNRYTRAVPRVVRHGRAFAIYAHELVLRHGRQASWLSNHEGVILRGLVQGIGRVNDYRGENAVFVGARVHAWSVAMSARGFFYFQVPSGRLLMQIIRSIVFVGVRELTHSSSHDARYGLTRATSLLRYVQEILNDGSVCLVVASVNRTRALFLDRLHFRRLLTCQYGGVFRVFLLMILLWCGCNLSAVCVRCPSRVTPVQPNFSVYQGFTEK